MSGTGGRFDAVSDSVEDMRGDARVVVETGDSQGSVEVLGKVCDEATCSAVRPAFPGRDLGDDIVDRAGQGDVLGVHVGVPDDLGERCDASQPERRGTSVDKGHRDQGEAWIVTGRPACCRVFFNLPLSQQVVPWRNVVEFYLPARWHNNFT